MFRKIPLVSDIHIIIVIFILSSIAVSPSTANAQAELVQEHFTAPVPTSDFIYPMKFQDEELVYINEETIYDGQTVQHILPEDSDAGINELSGTVSEEFDGKLIFSTGNELIEYDGTSFRVILGDEGSKFPDIEFIDDLEVYDNGNGPKLYFSGNVGSSRGSELLSYNGETFTNENILENSTTIGVQNLQTFDGINGPLLYFKAEKEDFNGELFAYDGNTLTEIDADASFNALDPQRLTVFDDGTNKKLYFGAEKENGDDFLMSYDGETLIDVTDAFELEDSFNNKKILQSSVDGTNKLYFIGFKNGNSGLFSFDGTATSFITEVVNTNTDVGLINFDGNIYFQSDTDQEGDELGVYNGETASVVEDIAPGTDDSNPFAFTVFNSGTTTELLFRTSQDQLMSFDGTSVTEIETNVPEEDGTETEQLVSVEDKVVFYSEYKKGNDAFVESDFIVYDGQTVTQLDRTQNNPNSTAPAPFNGVSEIEKIVFNGNLFFMGAADSTRDDASLDFSSLLLWSYDGNAITQIHEFDDFVGFDPDLKELIVYDDGSGEKLFFEDDGLRQYDGSSTSLVSDATSDIDDYEFATFDDGNGNILYFSADSEDSGNELWMYNGTEVGIVADLNEGTDGSNPEYLTVFNDGTGDKLFFAADDGNNGPGLYQFDGNSITFVSSIDNREGFGVRPKDLTVFNDGSGSKLYFAANVEEGSELMYYDGNEVALAETGEAQDVEEPENLYAVESSTTNRLYFSAVDGTNGRELWYFDGNTSTRVTDLMQGEGDSDPRDFISFDGELYFTAETQNEGREPRVFNGQSVQSLDMRPGNVSGSGTHPIIFDDGTGDELFVTGTNGINGFELYKIGPDDSPFSATSTSTETVAEGIPDKIELQKNYPNPFNPSTQITYSLPAATEVNLTIYDILGRKVKTLTDSFQRAGSHSVTFDASGLASGIYLYRLKANNNVKTRKMMLVK